uniref:Small ribosomal subunit protein mS31 n=1 Tax=Neogobius melanostomus TaxID=47308 RepID=A0A8C6SEU6_9GOBI
MFFYCSILYRLANTAGTKGLRTCSVKLCEKSEEVSPPEQDRIKSSDNKSAVDVKTNPSTETPNEKSNLEVASKSEKTAVVTEDESAAQFHSVTKKALVSTPKARTASLESTVSMFEKATVISSPQSEILALELVAAASAAASTLPNPSQAQSELLQQLRQHETITETQKNGDGNNIRVIIAEMKIGKNPNQNARSNARYTRERGITGELDSVRKRRNLFTSKRLNIFSASEVTGELTDERPTLWDIDFVNQLSTVTNQMPRNGFEEMIQWTQQGKLWQYPIDNEAGLEEEASVPFHEHIFLEKHLQEGFPRQGPVRHFMELVVAGLSKNPHLTVQQKKDHIFWFRDYFCQKEEILKEDDVYLN